jgi:hypothetical protein
MQMIEMYDMILYVLDRLDNVPHQAGIGRDLDLQGIFNSSHGAERMYRRSDTADALGKGPGISRIATL